MKQHKAGMILFFLFLSIGASAQINHFIYLQTENKQPFYVKLDKILMSSSSSGYLIIPKLKDGDYKLTVGFPKNEWTEQVFNCSIQQLDAGYLLKNFGDKGWGLFNLQSLDINMALNSKDAVPPKNADKTDAFSALLSNVVNDPAILKKETVKKEVVKAAIADSVVTPVAKPTVAVVAATVANKPLLIIKKLAETEANGAFHLVYLDTANDRSDSIDIIIPVDEQLIDKKVADTKENVEVKNVPVIDNTISQLPTAKEANKADEQQNMVETAVSEDKKVVPKEKMPVVVKDKEPNTEKKPKEKVRKPAKVKKEKFLPMELAPVSSVTDTLTKSVIVTTVTLDSITSTIVDSIAVKQSTGIINSDCISNATDEDFLKLRKKMAAAFTDDDMMEIAKKVLKQKCFSTEQIKNLAVLFLQDGGRYHFFDLAYPFVWDSYNYGSLENQLTDPYFNNRFKAMIRH